MSKQYKSYDSNKYSTSRRSAEGKAAMARRKAARADLAALARDQVALRQMAFTPPVIPGVTRTGGYYGRFRGPNAELKFFDTSLNFSFDATLEVPATGQLVLIPQGDTESTRDGRQCTIKSIQIRGVAVYVPGAAATASAVSYLWLVLDTQCNGAAAAATDVMTTTAANTCLINLANSDRFKILKKWVINQNPAAGATTAYNTQSNTIEFYKKCDIPLQYSSTTGAITEIRSNNIFLLAGCWNEDDKVTFGGTCRVRFQG